MNDCVVVWLGGCEGCKNGKCEKYLSANSEEGSSLLEEYQAEVEEAIKSIMEKYKARLAKFY
jgi:hypothetical protein